MMKICLLASLFLLLLVTPVLAGDSAQFGQAWSRNMVSSEKGLCSDFDPETGRNVRWSAELGSETHSTPVVGNGCVLVGTNNFTPRDPKHKGDRGVLMCFRETDGELLWQLVVPKRDEDPYFDWPNSGISSTATIEGNRAYIVTNRGEVACLDLKGMADGNDGPFVDEARHMTPADLEPLAVGPLDADILWLFNLTKGAGIWSHDAAHSSILIDGDQLYLNTGTGVDNTHKRIRTPDAPSLVVLDKRTGKMLARDRSVPATQIFHCTWSAPSLGAVDGERRLFFAGGNGIVYGYDLFRPGKDDTAEPGALNERWKFDFDPAAPKENVHFYNGNRQDSPSNIYGMPVFDNGMLYVAGGGDLWWGKNDAWLKCIDTVGSGDVTKTAEKWSYPLERHVMATPAISDGLIFISDTGKNLHCLDATTGTLLWKHPTKGENWASPLIADGKVYLASRGADLLIFAAARKKKILAEIKLDSAVSATAVAANGVVYVATMRRLYAVAKGEGK
ncbi:MAG: PQQ-binding-like beta-propeller repeat protein [Verrucomicrobiales bacterium]